MRLCLIAAVDSAWGIGKGGGIAWDDAEDRSFFKKMSMGRGRNGVVMGRLTWESLSGPLLGRVNIVLSSGEFESFYGEYWCKNLDEAICLGESLFLEELWIIGGRLLYIEGLKRCKREDVYIRHISGDYGCDVFFPVEFL